MNLAAYTLNTNPVLTASGENAVYSSRETTEAGAMAIPALTTFPSGETRTTRRFDVTRTTSRSSRTWSVYVSLDSNEDSAQARTNAYNPDGNLANLGGVVYRRAALIALGLREAAGAV